MIELLWFAVAGAVAGAVSASVSLIYLRGQPRRRRTHRHAHRAGLELDPIMVAEIETNVKSKGRHRA